MAKHMMGRDGRPLSALPPEEAEQLENDRNRHLAEVGRIASHWSFLEINIDTFALVLAGFYENQLGYCFTSQVSGISRKLAAYVSVIKFLGAPAPLIKRLNKLSERAVKLAERRNRAVHDPWSFGKPKPSRFEASARFGLKFARIEVATEELEKLSEDITDLTIAFDTIQDELMQALGIELT